MAVILWTSLSLWAGVACSFEPGVKGWGWYWSVGAEERSREGCLSLDVSSSWDRSVSEWVVVMGRKERTYVELLIRVCGHVCWVFRLLVLVLVLSRARGRLIEIASRQPPFIFCIRFGE